MISSITAQTVTLDGTPLLTLSIGAACALAVFASLAVTPLVVRAAARWGFYDVPRDGRRVHDRPIPRLGGVAVFAAVCASLAVAAASGLLHPHFAQHQARFLFALLAGGGLVFLAGVWDDLRGLAPLTKVAVQCVAAAIAFAFGLRVEVLSLGENTEVLLGAFAFPLTIAWIVGVTNAFNLIDGLDGLATGIGIVALATTLAVALALGNTEVALVCAALLGALLGFLRYNFSPARIFLGDSGSMFVGFMLAVLSVHGSAKSTTAVLALVPLFALALPLLDTLLAIVRRWLRGMPLASADARHIHHRLLAMGLTHRTAAFVLYVIAIGLAVLGLSLAFAPPTAVLAISVAGGGVSLLLLLYGMRRLDYHEFAEAGAVLAHGVVRVRRVIQDQIHARDVAQALQQATTLEQVDTVLQQAASRFGFLGLQVCREMTPAHQQLAGLEEPATRAWKLDYPVMPRRSLEDDPYVLRIWCGEGSAYRPYGAERAARILAPAIEAWLLQAGVSSPKAEDLELEPAPVLAPVHAPERYPDWAWATPEAVAGSNHVALDPRYSHLVAERSLRRKV